MPHFDSPDTIQHIVFRLADALPSALLGGVEATPARERVRMADGTLGYGERLLAEERAAAIVEAALLNFDGERSPPGPVYHADSRSCADRADRRASALRHCTFWKSFTAGAVNRRVGRAGRFWAPEYFDRFLRSEGQLERTRAPIEVDTVTAELCRASAEWRSARRRVEAGRMPALPPR